MRLVRLVERAWHNLPQRFRLLVADAFQVMPNHLHGILVIPGPGLEPALAAATGARVIEPVGPGLAPALDGAATGRSRMRDRPCGLGDVVGALKSISAIAVNGLLLRSGRHLGLEDYYEHVIRDVEELEKIRDYIFTNPARWLEDPENPAPPTGQGMCRAGACPGLCGRVVLGPTDVWVVPRVLQIAAA